MHVVGLILAHGQSRRFGSEKAAAIFNGAPLMLHPAKALQSVAQTVAVNARPGSQAAEIARRQGWPVLADEPGDADGPLAGIKVGLAWAADQGATHLAVAPCDAPLLHADLYRRLLGAIGDAPAAAPQSDAGVHPLTVVWAIAALPLVRQALARGAHPAVHKFLTQIRAKQVIFPDPEPFANVNTLDDLARLQIW